MHGSRISLGERCQVCSHSMLPRASCLSVPVLGRHFGVMAYSSASNQYPSGSLASLSIMHAFSSNVLFRHSATPLCCGVFGVVILWWVPLSFRDDSNCLPVYSPPPSVLITLSFCPVCSSSRASSSLKFWSTSDFSHSPTTKTFRE